MLDDITPSARKKPKVIEPLAKTAFTALPDLSDEVENDEPHFHPPQDYQAPPQPVISNHLLPAHTTAASKLKSGPTGGWKNFFTNWHWHLGQKQTVLLAALVLVLTVGGGISVAVTRPHVEGGVSRSQPHVKKEAPQPTIIYSSLTGLPVADASVNQRPVTGVMIENSPDARPQSGINQAGVVFEAIAEGGITRFLTLYQDSQPDYIGPVRSARPYYVQWCMSFDCSLAHVGGSPEALANIKTWGTKDLDQFANGGAYQRISSRYAPHNVYTSTTQLNQLEASKGYGASTYTGLLRKDDKPYVAPSAAAPPTSKTKTTPKVTPETRDPASSIDFAISGYYYNAHFDYDAASNAYKRSQAGAPHMAINKDGSQVQITPKAVVALVMKYGLEADDHHSQYNVIGTGEAYIFQDGTIMRASWAKSDIKSPFVLTDSAGKPIALNRGQTWFTALSAANQITYK